MGPEIADPAFVSRFLQSTKETLARHIGRR
jgi:hypothetical protein